MVQAHTASKEPCWDSRSRPVPSCFFPHNLPLKNYMTFSFTNQSKYFNVAKIRLRYLQSKRKLKTPALKNCTRHPMTYDRKN